MISSQAIADADRIRGFGWGQGANWIGETLQFLARAPPRSFEIRSTAIGPLTTRHDQLQKQPAIQLLVDPGDDIAAALLNPEDLCPAPRKLRHIQLESVAFRRERRCGEVASARSRCMQFSEEQMYANSGGVEAPRIERSPFSYLCFNELKSDPPTNATSCLASRHPGRGATSAVIGPAPQNPIRATRHRP